MSARPRHDRAHRRGRNDERSRRASRGSAQRRATPLPRAMAFAAPHLQRVPPCAWRHRSTCAPPSRVVARAESVVFTRATRRFGHPARAAARAISLRRCGERLAFRFWPPSRPNRRAASIIIARVSRRFAMRLNLSRVSWGQAAARIMVVAHQPEPCWGRRADRGGGEGHTDSPWGEDGGTSQGASPARGCAGAESARSARNSRARRWPTPRRSGDRTSVAS